MLDFHLESYYFQDIKFSHQHSKGYRKDEDFQFAMHNREKMSN
jgi:hypothetical protein